jgi:hypothetical protein
MLPQLSARLRKRISKSFEILRPPAPTKVPLLLTVVEGAITSPTVLIALNCRIDSAVFLLNNPE